MKFLKSTILVLFLGVTFSVTAQKNLVRNGDFELGLNFWNGNAATINPYEKKSGKNSCVINQYVGAEWKGIDQVINIPKKTYAIHFSVWIKSEAIEKGKEAYNAGVATLDLMTASQKNIRYENIAQVTGSTGWTLYEKQIVLPENAKKIRVMLALAQTNGSILFDKIKAVTISESDFIKQQEVTASNKPLIKVFNNGNFEDGTKNWRGNASVIVDEESNNKCAAITSNENVWVGIDQEVDIQQGYTSIDFSGKMKAKNIVQGNDTWNVGLWAIEFTKTDGTKAGQDESIGMISGTTNWKTFNKTIQIPEGATKYRIMFALGMCTGTLLVDDVTVKMIP